MVIDKPLTNAQLELLKMFSHDLSDSDLLVLRRSLAKFFADQASDEMDKIWEESGLSNEQMDIWLRGENESQNG
jgi:hypothetical protein